MCACPTTAHILSVMVDEEEGCEKFSRIPPTHLKFSHSCSYIYSQFHFDGYLHCAVVVIVNFVM